MTTLLAEADALYALPLGDFTPARDARAKELKGEDAGLSRAVKALRKPSLAAWVVNLLVRREAGQVAQVLQVGEALREAQAGMDAGELRALTKQRRQVTAAVTGRARALAVEAGQRVTEAVAGQVEATLTAAMVDAGCAEAVRSGQLVTALAATGVDEVDVASAVATPEALGFSAAPVEAPAEVAPRTVPTARPDLRVVPDPEAEEKARREARREAEERLAEADEAPAAATGEADEAHTAVADLQARGMQLQAELDELRRRIAELESQAEEADEELEEAEAAEEEARDAVAEARSARDAAAEALDRLA